MLDTTPGAELRACVIAFRDALKKVVFFSVVGNLLMLSLPLFAFYAIDNFVPVDAISSLLSISIVMLFAIISGVIIKNIGSIIARKSMRWIEGMLSPRIFSLIIQNATSETSNANQSLEDVKAIRNFINSSKLSQVIQSPLALIFAAALFLINPIMATVTAIGLALVVLSITYYESVIPELEKASYKNFIKAKESIEKATGNSEIIEALGMSQDISREWWESYEKDMVISSVISRKTNILLNIASLVKNTVFGLVLATSCYLLMTGKISTGVFVSGIIFSMMAFASMDNAVKAWSDFISVRNSYNRLKEKIESFSLRSEEFKLPDPVGNIEVENLVYRPQGSEDTILKNISFSINPGEVLGVIGHSGAGKTTLARMITGVFSPLSGAVRLDGVEVSRWNRFDFGKHTGYLPQDVELFDGTIKENISRMNSRASDSDIIEAAQKTGIHHMIESMPQGYNTKIGRDGISLSAGQKQRVGLARAFFGNPKMVILDEPNTSLDSDGDIALHGAIRQARKDNITLILISHKPSLMVFADKILVLRKGEAAAFGKREEIFARLNYGVNKTVKKPEKGDGLIWFFITQMQLKKL